MKRVSLFFLVILIICSCSAGGEKKAKKDVPYVLLISIDGFRHDYIDQFKPKNLMKFRDDGVSAESLVPPFPSKTFTSHYSMATGMYPVNHGLVANSFFDPKRKQSYFLGDRKSVEDGTWYGGNPIWNIVEENGYKAASFYWVGSEAKIKGRQPSYFYKYQKVNPSYKKRVEQVINWLKMPLEKRPRFITLYFEGVDLAGHFHLEELQKVKESIERVDIALGSLFAGLRKLSFPVNVVIVSDHGMSALSANKRIFFEDYLDLKNDLKGVRVIGKGPGAFLYFNNKDKIEIIEKKLKTAHRALHVYRAKKLSTERPEWKNLGMSKRVGDLIVTVDQPYEVFLSRKKMGWIKQGAHGYDPYKYKNMHGIFMANGPAFKNKMKVNSFDNIHIYPMILNLMGLPIPKNIDGELKVLRPILR